MPTERSHDPYGSRCISSAPPSTRIHRWTSSAALADEISPTGKPSRSTSIWEEITQFILGRSRPWPQVLIESLTPTSIMYSSSSNRGDTSASFARCGGAGSSTQGLRTSMNHFLRTPLHRPVPPSLPRPRVLPHRSIARSSSTEEPIAGCVKALCMTPDQPVSVRSACCHDRGGNASDSPQALISALTRVRIAAAISLSATVVNVLLLTVAHEGKRLGPLLRVLRARRILALRRSPTTGERHAGHDSRGVYRLGTVTTTRIALLLA